MRFKVLHDFRGSQDGCAVTEFKAGTEVEISDHLAPHVAAWAEPIAGEIQNKAVITDGAPRRVRQVRPPAAAGQANPSPDSQE